MKKTVVFVSMLFSGIVLSQKITPNEVPGTVFHFDSEKFEKRITDRRHSKGKISNEFIVLPVAGKDTKFSLKENGLSENRLSDIITFDGVSEDGKSSMKLSVFNDKINALVKTDQGYFYVEPYKTGKNELRMYSAFSDFGAGVQCGVDEDHMLSKELNQMKNSLSVTNFPYGGQIKKFRMAVAATGEFTAAFNGDKDAALAELVNMVNLINKIYESEVAITFTLISKTTDKSLIFSNAATDPFTVDPNFSSAANSQTGFDTMKTDGTLAYNQYDIGHTFNILSTNAMTANGQAGPQPCNDTSKARAWSQWSLTMPKGMVANVIVHEMGHQFSAGHTYNAVGGSAGSPTFCTSGWSAAAAVEPGGGTTIMSYGNNCTSPSDQTNTGEYNLNYFNAKSLDQILNNIQNSANCYTTQAVNNVPPVANAGADISIPKNTPFKLKGTGSDNDNTNLSYTWEQADVASANDKGAFGSAITGTGGYNALNSTTAPLFRSEQSTSTTERYFPKMAFVLNNQNSPETKEAEALPLVARTMKFRFTVRDNNVTNGGLDSDEISVTVTNDGPLSVSYPNATGVSVSANTAVNVQWTVNGTDNIKDKVNILLSLDGGDTFPITLASDAVNNGSKSVTIPNVPATDRARIKVVGVINPNAEFFDVSDNNFTVSSTCVAYSTLISPVSSVSAASGNAAANLNMSAPPAAGVSYLSKTFVYNTPSVNNAIIVYTNNSMTQGSVVSITNNYPTHTIKFRVTKTGSYQFQNAGNSFLTMAIHSGNPGSTGNFITSNGYSTGGGGVSASNTTKAAVLNAGTDYYFIASNLSNPASAASYTFNVTGEGSVYKTSAPPAGYSYTFTAVNNSTGKIAAVSTSANFTTLPVGAYIVKGISYKTSDVSNTSVFVGKNISEVMTSYCVNESSNSRPLTITSGTVLGISEADQKSSGITAAPNPVKDILKVKTEKQVTHYEIYDFSGKSLRGKPKFTEEISFKDFTAGTYILVLYDNNTKVYTTKIIKK
ncbi:Por secretion system C-terminal sorting domain-containing protein [Chryseobacterium oleae]|uniref:Por secretion system C-terminal sorting domain-containing protein n=1 Tax=Chryseobacterium oleae TaxID=491207 RepID=A0A1I4YIH2_CHROL|nr:zinc-dependent metalloprotease [Chryseobacterium oleae]SFN37812.1 Por secretion system C-terminal sorting domain-containing protein [Chryseobacterium oleae]